MLFDPGHDPGFSKINHDPAAEFVIGLLVVGEMYFG